MLRRRHPQPPFTVWSSHPPNLHANAGLTSWSLLLLSTQRDNGKRLIPRRICRRHDSVLDYTSRGRVGAWRRLCPGQRKGKGGSRRGGAAAGAGNYLSAGHSRGVADNKQSKRGMYRVRGAHVAPPSCRRRRRQDVAPAASRRFLLWWNLLNTKYAVKCSTTTGDRPEKDESFLSKSDGPVAAWVLKQLARHKCVCVRERAKARPHSPSEIRRLQYRPQPRAPARGSAGSAAVIRSKD